MKLGEVEVDPTSYVDDVANLREGATEAGRRMSNAVNEMSLKAHPTKTMNIVIGGTKKSRENLRKELKDDPMQIQGFDVKSVEADVYLGMKVSKGGCKDSVDASIKARRAKALVKMKMTKIILKDLCIQAVDAARTLYQQTILPILTCPDALLYKLL